MATKTKKTNTNEFIQKVVAARKKDLSTTSARKEQRVTNRLAGNAARKAKATKQATAKALSTASARKEQTATNAASAKQRQITKNDLSTAGIRREQNAIRRDEFRGKFR